MNRSKRLIGTLLRMTRWWTCHNKKKKKWNVHHRNQFSAKWYTISSICIDYCQSRFKYFSKINVAVFIRSHIKPISLRTKFSHDSWFLKIKMPDLNIKITVVIAENCSKCLKWPKCKNVSNFPNGLNAPKFPNITKSRKSQSPNFTVTWKVKVISSYYYLS